MKSKSKGKVFLVGSGPGDPGLVTIKAWQVMQTVDLIIYDYLASHTFLDKIDCEKIYAGKKEGSHSLPQEEINQLLINEAVKGKQIVRLKGGDPFIFGRGGEEAEELVKAGIDFEVIPGISSFYSVPAYAGIPLTHRDYADSFEVITGHRRSDKDESKITLPEYRENKTFIFLMGMKNLEFICNELINTKNFPENIPVAVIQEGTTFKQQAVSAPLKDIFNKVVERKLKAPAVIIIGKVVNLHKKIDWRSKNNLAGKKIMITRTRKQASELSDLLAAKGAFPVEFPVIKIEPVKDQRKLHESIKQVENYNWLIFTSVNAVEIFFENLYNLNYDSRKLYKNKIAVIGEITARKLNDYGVKADLIPPDYVAESLLESFSENLQDANILIPCSKEARYFLKGGLEKRGASVKRIHIYNTILPETGNFDLSDIDIVTFTSSSTVHNFFKLFKGKDFVAAAIGPVTANTLEKYDKKAVIVARNYTIKGLVEALDDYYAR